jgi:hypothetical protein
MVGLLAPGSSDESARAGAADLVFVQPGQIGKAIDMAKVLCINKRFN